MSNSNVILIEEQEKEDARALTQSFARSDIKSRAYINALGARICMKYFEQENISSEPSYNLHSIRKILEEFDISDIKLPNIHIDVRVIFDENQIFIPKSHFEYNLLPDIYVVLKLDKEHKNTEFLGFFEPKLINKNNANSDYYFIEKEKLSSPVDLKSFIEHYSGTSNKEYSEDDIVKAETLMVSMADNNVTDEEKRTLLDYLVNNAELRDEFIEYENFEMISYQAVNSVGLELPVNTDEIDIAEIPTEELPEDITDSAIEETISLDEDIDISETLENNNESLNEENLIKGTAILGAEIAGTAIASAALAGAESTVDSAANIINAAANVANITSDAIDMASSIQNMAEQVFSDENPVEPEISEPEVTDLGDTTALDELSISEDILSDSNTTEIEDTMNTDLFSELDNLQQVEQPSEITDNIEQTNENSELNNSLDELFSDFGTTSDEENNEITFQENTSDNSDELVFENYSDDNEITFSNNDDYGDYVEYGDSSDSYDNYSTPEKPQNILAQGLHTPISEATDLMSLEDIQNNNLPKASAPEPVGDIMETMEMEEFHELVNNYVPEEIKDESETIGLDTIPEQSVIPQPTPEEAKQETESIPQELSDFDSLSETDLESLGNFANEMQDMESLTSGIELNEELTSDDFTEEMPQEINNLNTLAQTEDENSDSFTEEMPQEINDLNALAQTDDLNSDSFTEEMPQEINDLSALTQTEDLNSDSFTEEMPEEINDLSTLAQTEDLNSDSFTEEMPEEINDLSALAQTEELNSDNFTEEMPEEINTNTTAIDIPQESVSEPAETSILDELSQLDSLGLGEIEPAQENVSESQNETETDNPVEEETKLQVLYDGNAAPELDTSELEEPLEEDYNFKPEKKPNKLMPLFAVLAAIVIVGAFVGFFMKNKNSIDAETLIQTTPENEILATPEANNSDIMSNSGEGAIPNIPKDAADMSPSAPAAPVTPTATSKTAEKPAVKATTPKTASAAPVRSNKPLNGSKTITLKKVSWEVPDYLSYSNNIRKYLQTAGKSIKLTLSSDLLLTNDYIYSNQVKVDIKLNKDGVVQSANVVRSSGSEQVDKIVLRTVKETLNVVKPARGEVPTPNYNLAIIIYL